MTLPASKPRATRKSSATGEDARQAVPVCFTSRRQPTPSGSATRAQRNDLEAQRARDFRRQRRAGQSKFGMWTRGNVVGRGPAAAFAADMRGVSEPRAESGGGQRWGWHPAPDSHGEVG